MITIKTNHGDIELELDYENTPVTAENFVNYVKSGFYNDTIFHRVIKNFMIQGGGYDADMDEKRTNAPIKNEADKGQSNKRGTIAMARTSDPHSATAQFFINVVDNPFLDHSAKNSMGWGYCVFGQVTAGMDVVDTIKAVATGYRAGHDDVPTETVLIERIIVDEDNQ